MTEEPGRRVPESEEAAGPTSSLEPVPPTTSMQPVPPTSSLEPFPPLTSMDPVPTSSMEPAAGTTSIEDVDRVAPSGDPDRSAGAWTAPPPDAWPVRRGVRVRTVVFGLVMATLAVLSLVAMLTDVRLDGSVVGLVLLVGAGAALVGGGIASAVRETRGGPGGR